MKDGKAVEESRTLSIDSCNAGTVQESIVMLDPHSIGIWDVVKEVPSYEMNSSAELVGRFWENMKGYIHARALWLFKWHLS